MRHYIHHGFVLGCWIWTGEGLRCAYLHKKKTSKNLSPQLAKAIGIPLANMYPNMLVLLQPMRHLILVTEGCRFARKTRFETIRIQHDLQLQMGNEWWLIQLDSGFIRVFVDVWAMEMGWWYRMIPINLYFWDGLKPSTSMFKECSFSSCRLWLSTLSWRCLRLICSKLWVHNSYIFHWAVKSWSLLMPGFIIMCFIMFHRKRVMLVSPPIFGEYGDFLKCQKWRVPRYTPVSQIIQN